MLNTKFDQAHDAFEKALQKAAKEGATAAKGTYHEGWSEACSFESGKFKSLKKTENIHYSLSVIKNGKSASVSGNDWNDVDEMLKRAIAMTAIGRPMHFQKYPTPQQPACVINASEATRALSNERMLEAGGHIVDSLKAYDSGLDIHASASKSESRSFKMTSGGTVHQDEDTSWGLNGMVQRTEGTDMMFAGFGRGWGHLNEYYDPQLIIDRITLDLERAKQIARCESGQTRIFLPPEMVSQFLVTVRLAVNGRNVAKGESPFTDRLGESVLADNVTIWDNPHLDFAGGPEIDGDGVPTRKQLLIKNGVLQRFLYNVDTAAMVNVSPTGNGSCAPYCMMVTPGTKSSDQLLTEMDEGVFLRSLIGFGQSNIKNGDFSANVGLGYRVKNGQVVGRIKDAMLSGNLLEIFNGTVEFSSDVDPLSQMPYAIVSGVHLSA